MRVAVLGRTKWLIDAADALRGRGHEIVLVATAQSERYYNCETSCFEALAKRCHAKYLGAKATFDAGARHVISASNPDVAISVNWPTVIGKDIIEKIPHGIFNAHCGDLPRYRGNACPNWAIINGENRIGLCIHLMDPEALDSGPVVARSYLAVDEGTYITDVYRWLDSTIPMLMVEAVEGVVAGRIQSVPQPEDASLALRCYPRRPEDGRIDWRSPATIVHRLIRASSKPFDGAFTTMESGARLTVWKASLFKPESPFSAVPGQVMLRSGKNIVIACGKGCLLIEECEVEGRGLSESTAIVARSLRQRLI